MTIQRQFPVTLTDAAKEHIRKSLAEPKHAGALGLRISLKQAGCSGLKYLFTPATNIEAGDLVEDIGGTRVLVSVKDEMYLLGSTVDFVRDGLNSSFKVNNPLEKGSCGCGESVTIKPATPSRA